MIKVETMNSPRARVRIKLHADADVHQRMIQPHCEAQFTSHTDRGTINALVQEEKRPRRMREYPLDMIGNSIPSVRKTR